MEGSPLPQRLEGRGARGRPALGLLLRKAAPGPWAGARAGSLPTERCYLGLPLLSLWPRAWDTWKL